MNFILVDSIQRGEDLINLVIGPGEEEKLIFRKGVIKINRKRKKRKKKRR